MPPLPKIYEATYMAASAVPTRLIADNRRAAQRYVDKITKTDWWKSHCPGFWDFHDPPPERVWVWLVHDDDVGACVTHEVTILGQQEMPTMVVGKGIVNGIEANRDPWVYLHELAHVMAWNCEGSHGRDFCQMYVALVRQFLSPRHADALLTACKAKKIRLPYRLLAA